MNGDRVRDKHFDWVHSLYSRDTDGDFFTKSINFSKKPRESNFKLILNFADSN